MMRRTTPRAADYAACYGLYVLVLLLAYALFTIWRQAALVLTGLVVQGPANGVVDGTIVVLIGLLIFVLVIAGEPYLRGGLHRGDLVRRFARLAAPEVVLILIGLALLAL